LQPTTHKNFCYSSQILQISHGTDDRPDDTKIMPILLVKNKLPQQQAESSAKKAGEIDQKPSAVTGATSDNSTKPELARGGDNEQTKKSKKQRKSRFASAYYTTALVLPADQPWNVRVAPVAKFRSPTVALGLACVHVTDNTNLANPFKLNDVILKINGAILSNTPVTSAKGMLKKERSKSKGKECRLEILRLKESHRDDPTVNKKIPVKLIPSKLDLNFKSNHFSSSLGEDHARTIDEHVDHNGDDVQTVMPKDTTLTLAQNKEEHKKGHPPKMVDAACQTEPITMTSSCTQTLSPTKPTYASTYVQTETETLRKEKETKDRNAHPRISQNHNHEDSHEPERKRSRLMTTDTTSLKSSSSQRRHAGNEPGSIMQEQEDDSPTVSQYERSSVEIATSLAATLTTNTIKDKDNISESISNMNPTLSKNFSSLPFDPATATTSTNSTTMPNEVKKEQELEQEKIVELDMLTKSKRSQSDDDDVGDEYSDSSSNNSSSSSSSPKPYTEEEEVEDLNIRRTTTRKRKFMSMARAAVEEKESSKGEPTDARLKRSALRSKNNVVTGLAEDKAKIPLHEESESSKPTILSHRELVTERDREHVGEYLLLLMKQFLKYDASSHNNKRRSKTSSSGSFFDNRALMARMVCRHCENSVRPYCFTPTSRSLGSRFKSNHAHFLKCRRCPKKVKEDLERLEKAQTQQWVKCRQNAESKFYERVWARLNSFDPAECFEATSDEESDSE